MQLLKKIIIINQTGKNEEDGREKKKFGSFLDLCMSSLISLTCFHGHHNLINYRVRDTIIYACHP
jgi:hypothetical protein